MKLHELFPAPGANHKRKRVGRGNGSGHGTTATRGTKGQKSRSGGQINPRFEGGQLPIVKRLPYRRGFTNIFRVEYTPVNVGRLADFPAGADVDPLSLVAAGIIKSASELVKVLGKGELDQPLSVWAHGFSAGARAKIEAAGGSVKLLGDSPVDEAIDTPEEHDD